MIVNQNLIEFKAGIQQGGEQIGGGYRGKIKGFSKGARARMIKRISSLKEYPVMWQDFTFADDVMESLTIEEQAVYSSNCLKLFKRLIETAYSGSINGIWRREWETRKSGNLKGQECPHFHMLLGKKGLTEKNYRDVCLILAQVWVAITKTAHKKALAVAISEKSYRWLVNNKMAQIYVSKYVAKEEMHEDDNFSRGRYWGFIGKPEKGEQEEIKLTTLMSIEFRRLFRRYLKKGKLKKLTRHNTCGFWLIIPRHIIKRMEEFILAKLKDIALNQCLEGVPF